MKSHVSCQVATIGFICFDFSSHFPAFPNMFLDILSTTQAPCRALSLAKVCALALQKVNFMFQVENQTNCNSKRCDQQGAQHLPPKHRRRNRNSCHNATMPTSIAITSGRPKALSNKIRIKRFESCGEAPTCVNILTPCFDTEPKGRGRGRGRGVASPKGQILASLPRDKSKPDWHRQLMPL